MESITIKVHEGMLKEIEKCIKPSYGTKSEFIREAIREKLEEKRKQEIIEKLRQGLGSVKRKTTPKEEEEIGERVVMEIAKELGIDLN